MGLGRNGTNFFFLIKMDIFWNHSYMKRTPSIKQNCLENLVYMLYKFLFSALSVHA